MPQRRWRLPLQGRQRQARTLIRWNLSNTDTFGPLKCVLAREVSSLERAAWFYDIRTWLIVLIFECCPESGGVLIQGCHLGEFHCSIAVHVHKLISCSFAAQMEGSVLFKSYDKSSGVSLRSNKVSISLKQLHTSRECAHTIQLLCFHEEEVVFYTLPLDPGNEAVPVWKGAVPNGELQRQILHHFRSFWQFFDASVKLDQVHSVTI